MEDAVRARLLDSLVHTQGDKIVLLEAEKAQMSTTFHRMSNMASIEQQKQMELTSHYKSLYEHYEKENKKLRRGLKVWKVLLPVGVVGSLFVLR